MGYVGGRGCNYLENFSFVMNTAENAIHAPINKPTNNCFTVWLFVLYLRNTIMAVVNRLKNSKYVFCVINQEKTAINDAV